MSLRLFPVVFYLLLCTTTAPAQKPAEARFLNRFSFTATTTYFRNPWNDYNRAAKTVVRQVELDTYFLYPTGSYEKINGDLIFRGEFGFRVIKNLRVLLTGSFGQLNSVFELFPNTSKLPPLGAGSPAFHQKLDFGVKSIGLGFSYEFSIGKNLALLPQITLERSSGTLDLDWRYDSSSRGPVGADTGEHLSASLSDATRGINVGIAINWKLYKHVSLLVGLDYRQVEFNKMLGSATFGYPSLNRVYDINVELVQAANYFGVRDRFPDDNVLFGLPSLRFSTQPREDAREPAVIDLTAFGLRTGIQWSF